MAAAEWALARAEPASATRVLGPEARAWEARALAQTGPAQATPNRVDLATIPARPRPMTPCIRSAAARKKRRSSKARGKASANARRFRCSIRWSSADECTGSASRSRRCAATRTCRELPGVSLTRSMNSIADNARQWPRSGIFAARDLSTDAKLTTRELRERVICETQSRAPPTWRSASPLSLKSFRLCGGARRKMVGMVAKLRESSAPRWLRASSRQLANCPRRSECTLE